MKRKLQPYYPTGLAGLMLAFFVLVSYNAVIAQSPPPLEWPEIQNEQRPWSRWWWMGNSVNEKDLTANMEVYKAAGLGGLEITPIYGVAGFEDQFIDYLSPEWIEKLEYTLAEADRIGLGIDMATGTGWPFGGPWIQPEHASKNVVYRTFELNGGERLDSLITYTQEPYLRTVGNQIYELYGILRARGEQTEGTRQQPPLRQGAEPVDITRLVEPIRDNENLQALAIDQVQFQKELQLQALVAYSDAGEVLDLTENVDENGSLDWVAPAGRWTLYAVFQGWHGKMVERAAPGGEGYVIDHFSEDALETYLEQFDRAFSGKKINGLRGFFNDSYEVDDARGQANWTPDLFNEFEKRKGYDLRLYLPALFGSGSEENNVRVLTDYRDVVSDLILDEFTKEWKEWAHDRGKIVRNQAHGSPANILDLYAASDIPETEGTEILRIKFASSAANVSGKKLASAEAATWLNEHFTSSLADVKEAVDRYFLGGVNHIFYHGTNYSPSGEPWPGWLFYAAVHFSPANSFWDDFSALNEYVARVQSFLQAGKPDNDILLYFPVYDRYADRGPELLRHFDGVGEEFAETVFNQDAAMLADRGYAFDFISDTQLMEVDATGSQLTTGGAAYQTIVLSEVQYMPVSTFERLIELAKSGATIVVHNQLPSDVPGMANLEERRNRLRELTSSLQFASSGSPGVEEARRGNGRFLLGSDLNALLTAAEVRRESMVEQGLQFVRRKGADHTTYFMTSRGENAVDGWVTLAVRARSAAIFNPTTGESGMAVIRPLENGGTEIFVQLLPGESWIVQAYEDEKEGPAYAYYSVSGEQRGLDGPWSVRFVKGGPEFPQEQQLETLASWTEWGGEAARKFSGTARYSVQFSRPQENADAWLLDLGTVHESARVRLNGREMGTLIGPSYQIRLDQELLQANNTLEIDVSNLMANRIADLDRQNVVWKKFYNVNFPSRLRENRNEKGLFDASGWEPMESGLLGPVTLTPVSVRQDFSSR